MYLLLVNGFITLLIAFLTYGYYLSYRKYKYSSYKGRQTKYLRDKYRYSAVMSAVLTAASLAAFIKRLIDLLL